MFFFSFAKLPTRKKKFLLSHFQPVRIKAKFLLNYFQRILLIIIEQLIQSDLSLIFEIFESIDHY